MRTLSAIVFLADGGDDDRFDDLRVARRVGIPTYVVPNSAGEGPVPSVEHRDGIISVGSYTPAKGFDFVLRAYAGSTAKNKIPLALYGQTQTPFVDRLRALAHTLGIAPTMVTYNVGVSGNELLSEYGKARVFVSGSHTECQPLVLLDAMRTGTPFVARATGCISRMPGGVSVRTEVAAANELSGLLADETRWATLSQTGLRAAHETYAPRRNAELFLKVLEDVVGRG
jgi:glycosyltransferase involved in cell wall biosynthesis